MNKTLQIVIAFVLGGLVTFGVQYAELGQGRIFTTKKIDQSLTTQSTRDPLAEESSQCEIPQIVATLNPSSPSGARAVNVKDNAAIFNLTAVEEDIQIGAIKLKYISDSDFNITNWNNSIYEAGVDLSTGQDTTSSIERTLYFENPIDLKAGTTKTIANQLDTVTLLNESAGVDDPLIVELLEVYDIDGFPILENSVTSKAVMY